MNTAYDIHINVGRWGNGHDPREGDTYCDYVEGTVRHHEYNLDQQKVPHASGDVVWS